MVFRLKESGFEWRYRITAYGFGNKPLDKTA
jgi:hypothetical protein